MRLLLVAHASTSATRHAAFPRDEPLDEAGRKSAYDLAPKFDARKPSRTSPLLRAVQTAEALKLQASIDLDLRELDVGRWTGRRIAEIGVEEPEALELWMSDPSANPHGGETIDQLGQRAAAWLETLIASDHNVTAITHSAFIRAAVVSVLAADPASFWRIDISPLTRVELSSNGRRWTLKSMIPAA